MDSQLTIEGLAIVLTLTYVVLAIVQSVWCWPAGFVGAGLTLLVCVNARLYGASALQVVYMALMVYGWYQWRQGGDEGGRLEVSRTPGRWWIALGITGAVFAALLGVLLAQRTDAALPFWDAGTTSFSLVAQFMTTRKWVESWPVWVAVDAVYVGIFVSQELHLMTALYLALIGFAVAGYLGWRRSMSTGEAAAETSP